MPLYTYECSIHGEFDESRPMNDDSPVLCGKCGQKSEKIMTTFAIYRGSKIGNTREELFDNLAADGLGAKDWRESYAEHY